MKYFISIIFLVVFISGCSYTPTQELDSAEGILMGVAQYPNNHNKYGRAYKDKLAQAYGNSLSATHGESYRWRNYADFTVYMKTKIHRNQVKERQEKQRKLVLARKQKQQSKQSGGYYFGINAAKPGESDSDKALKALKKYTGMAIAKGSESLQRGKREQANPPIYTDSDKKIFQAGKNTDRTKTAGIRADIKWGSVSKSLKEKGSTITGKAFVPVQITGISSSKGNHTIKAEVELKIKLVDSCKNFGCGRRDITIDTYKKTVTLKTSGVKPSKETIYFSDVLFGKETDSFLSFTKTKKIIANPRIDIRITAKILSVK